MLWSGAQRPLRQRSCPEMKLCMLLEATALFIFMDCAGSIREERLVIEPSDGNPHLMSTSGLVTDKRKFHLICTICFPKVFKAIGLNQDHGQRVIIIIF